MTNSPDTPPVPAHHDAEPVDAGPNRPGRLRRLLGHRDSGHGSLGTLASAGILLLGVGVLLLGVGSLWRAVDGDDRGGDRRGMRAGQLRFDGPRGDARGGRGRHDGARRDERMRRGDRPDRQAAERRRGAGRGSAGRSREQDGSTGSDTDITPGTQSSTDADAT